MVNQPYYRTGSPSEFKLKYPDAKVILELDDEHLKLSASKWGIQHLIACRVIQEAGGTILPILEKYAPKPEDLEHNDNWGNIEPLIFGPSKEDLKLKSRLELEQENGPLGTLWSALAKCIALNKAVEERTYPQRDRKQVQKFTSGDCIETESSSPSEPSSSQQESHEKQVQREQSIGSDYTERGSSSPSESPSGQSNYNPDSSNGSEVDEDEHIDRAKPEILTVNLAGAFIRYVLNFCAGQDPKSKMLAEFQEQPNQNKRNLGHLKIDATDDGGIWKVTNWKNGKGPWMPTTKLALLEAKREFKFIDTSGLAVIPDNHLSQYTCEALAACPPGDQNSRDVVFVILMTQSFMCFLNFNRTEEYMRYLCCSDVDQQKKLASNTFLYVTDTDFFKLDTIDGRRHAVCNLLGLVKLWESEGELRRNDDDISSSDLEGSKEGGFEINTSDDNFNTRDRKRQRNR